MRTFGLLCLTFAFAAAVPAATITNTQGTQNFTNGIQLDVFGYLAGNTDVTAPFDFESGLDGDEGDGGANFDVTWTHNFIPFATIPWAAKIRIGLYEHESAEPGSQLLSLTINGLFSALLTPLLDAGMEASGGTTVYDMDGFPASTEYNVYSIALPAAVLSELAGGSAQFRLQLQGPGVSVLGASQFNGAFIDFAELTLTDVPEPSAAVLLGIALPLMVWLRRR